MIKRDVRIIVNNQKEFDDVIETLEILENIIIERTYTESTKSIRVWSDGTVYTSINPIGTITTAEEYIACNFISTYKKERSSKPIFHIGDIVMVVRNTTFPDKKGIESGIGLRFTIEGFINEQVYFHSHGIENRWLLADIELISKAIINKDKTDSPRNGNNSKVKNIITKIVDFAKNINLDADEKILREVGLKDYDCGNYTEEARLVVKDLEAKNLGFKSLEHLQSKVGTENRTSAIEYAKLFKEHEAKLIEIAKAMKESEKK